MTKRQASGKRQMRIYLPTPYPLPRYAWSRELATEQWTVSLDKPVELTNRDALPLVVVANGKEQRFAAIKNHVSAISADVPAPLALTAMVQANWRWQDGIDGSAGSFEAAAGKQLVQTQELLSALLTSSGPEFLEAESRQRVAMPEIQ